MATRQAFMLAVTICVGSSLSHGGTSTLPFQIGALVAGSGRSAAQAGVFGSAESIALAVSMVLISPWVGRISPRLIAIAGCAVALVANWSLLWVQAATVQIALGAMAGGGYGLVFAATVAAAAATPEPDRMYAIGNGGALVLISALLAALPVVAAHAGPLAIFAALGALALGSSPFFLTFRVGKPVDTPQLSAWRTPGAAGLLVSWILYSGGTAAVYAFSERIGAGIALTSTQIATVLSSGLFVGLLGAAAAAALGRRVKRQWALIVGIVGSGLSCLALGYASSLLTFAIDIFAYWIFCMFLYSYLLGTAAVLDPAGRVGTLGGGLEKMGVAVGVFAAGQLAQHASYSATGLLGLACCLVGLAVGFPSVFRALSRLDKEPLPPVLLRE
jgi:hypothetical protein